MQETLLVNNGTEAEIHSNTEYQHQIFATAGVKNHIYEP